ncbi:MAG: hypothetical protein ACM3MM_00105, partial [Acidobacteriota bacterium]
MSNEMSAPLPRGLVNTGLNEEIAASRQVGRRQIVGGIIGVTGLALVFGVAPNISSETKSIAFEPPPDPLQVSFNPVVVITVIGVFYVLAGVASFLPARFDRL